MRLDLLYVLGALGGGSTDPQVCTSNAHSHLPAVREVTWAPTSRTLVGVTAFVNVNVVPMDTERVLSNHTVLVEGGQITALGPANQVQVPAGATRIDGQGKYLIPGLVDMHVHKLKFSNAVIPNLQAYLADGITAVRTLEGPDIDGMQKLRHVADTTKLPIPRLYLARSIPPSTRPDSVAAHVAASQAAGYDHLGTHFLMMSPRRPEAYAALLAERVVLDSLIAAAHRVGLPISAHSHRFPFDAVLAVGRTGGSFEHLSSVFYDTLGIWKSEYWMTRKTQAPPTEVPMAKILPLAAALKQAGVWVTPTLDCHEKNKSHTKVVSVASFRTMVKALHDAGVGLFLSTDDTSTVQDELEALVRAGLSPYHALATGTRNVAQYFRVLDRAGTVAVGKQADLVLLNGNPFADIRHARAPAGVMVAGRWLDRAALDQVRPAPPPQKSEP